MPEITKRLATEESHITERQKGYDIIRRESDAALDVGHAPTRVHALSSASRARGGAYS